MRVGTKSTLPLPPPRPPRPPRPPPRPPDLSSEFDIIECGSLLSRNLRNLATPYLPPEPPGLVKRLRGSNLSVLMYTKSSSTKLFARIPGSIFMVNITKFNGPKISSILPIFFLFSRYIPALKYGIFVSGCVSLHTSSDSHSCSTLPHSEIKELQIRRWNRNSRSNHERASRTNDLIWRAFVSASSASFCRRRKSNIICLHKGLVESPCISISPPSTLDLLPPRPPLPPPKPLPPPRPLPLPKELIPTQVRSCVMCDT